MMTMAIKESTLPCDMRDARERSNGQWERAWVVYQVGEGDFVSRALPSWMRRLVDAQDRARRMADESVVGFTIEWR